MITQQRVFGYYAVTFVLALKLFEPSNSSLRVGWDENDKYIVDKEIEI